MFTMLWVVLLRGMNIKTTTQQVNMVPWCTTVHHALFWSVSNTNTCGTTLLGIKPFSWTTIVFGHQLILIGPHTRHSKKAPYCWCYILLSGAIWTKPSLEEQVFTYSLKSSGCRCPNYRLFLAIDQGVLFGITSLTGYWGWPRVRNACRPPVKFQRHPISSFKYIRLSYSCNYVAMLQV